MLISKAEILIVISVLSIGSGCALTQERVRLSYAPQVGVQKIERASSSAVTVEVIDSRTVKDRVGSKHNAYGMEMAAISSEEDVPSLIKRSVETELENRGFHLRTSKAQVLVELVKFENDFKFGWLSADAVANLLMHVKVKEATGQVLYSKALEGKGLNSGAQILGGQNAKIALDAALKDAMATLFQDQLFLESVVKAGTET